MILMFACAFPPTFAFAAVNNLMEIRTDALKLLVILRRHVPRAAATVGVWLNIFQVFIYICKLCNCAILAWLYDEEGKWKIEPGLAAILIMEHVLLLTKFGFSHFFPEVIVLLPKSKCMFENTFKTLLVVRLFPYSYSFLYNVGTKHSP
ncbi:Anoctamin-like protein [Glycine soja]|uniref:Anoctamin-like protein n=1 Tax=Glycine soja TaxID=3848 RepID=A0A445FDD1_GLYSO|nr:Anoctamin-like protein [Glycine soja]